MSLASFEAGAEKFLLEIEAVVAKYLPFATGAAEAVEAGTGNPELIPITGEAAGAAEAALAAAQNIQDGNLQAAMTGVAQTISSIKGTISATKQVAAPVIADPAAAAS